MVDITQEHEKYGNDGYRAFDHKLIDAYEGLANIINKLIDVSIDATDLPNANASN